MHDVINQLINTTFGWNWPGWVISLISYLLVATLLFLIAPFQMLFLTYFERRAIARMQDRVGPNRVGPEGLFQPVADGVKMFTKEDIVPDAADKWIHLIAPCVVVAPTMFMFAVVPWGPGMVPVNMNVGLLFFFAISSVSAVGLMMAGWASSNKFALLGAMRAVAQMVSYEIPAVLSLLAIVLITGSLSIVDLINYQGGLIISSRDLAGVPDFGLGWFIFTPVGFLAFIAFFIAALAEGERTPFDIPEANSEIVAGYMTEYSGHEVRPVLPGPVCAQLPALRDHGDHLLRRLAGSGRRLALRDGDHAGEPRWRLDLQRAVRLPRRVLLPGQDL